MSVLDCRVSHWPTVLALHIATWLHRQPAADPAGPSEYLQPARTLEEASRLCSENVLCPLHLHCRYKHFAFIATTITITTEGEGCAGGGSVNSAGTEKSLRGQRVRTGDGEREKERECNIYCLQSLVYYFTCISLGSLLPLFTLPPTPLVLPLCWYSSGSFVIYVALCRAWLARTFVNSKRPVSISWQASLYTVCPESATLPPLLPPFAPHPCRHWTWLCGFFMF